MPRKKKLPAPPGLAEDADELREEARSAPAERDSKEPGDVRRSRKGGKRAQSAASSAAPAPPPELPFPVEAIAQLHLHLWTALAKRLRSKWELTDQGALEMANYGEMVIRQYLGPLLADHAALAAYLMTQGSALLAVVALREEPKPEPKPMPPAGGLYATPVSPAELRPPVAPAA